MASHPDLIALDGPRYEIAGACNNCGDCCRGEACEHFVDRGDKGYCAIIDDPERRPLGCRIYPHAPPIIYPRCSFRFWDRWEGRAVRPGEV